MSSACSSPSLEPEPPFSQELWWLTVPQHGDVKYVEALSALGMHMAERVPKRVQENAITELGVAPKTDLLTGDFNTKTKERNIETQLQFQCGILLLRHTYIIYDMDIYIYMYVYVCMYVFMYVNM